MLTGSAYDAADLALLDQLLIDALRDPPPPRTFDAVVDAGGRR